MHKPRLLGALAAGGAALGVALLSAGTANAADPVQLRSHLGNWCLDGPNGSNAATVVNACTGAKSQLWTFNPAGQIESVGFPGQCLSISTAADNTPVVLASCQTNTDNQRWNHEANGKITSPLGPCLNVFGGVAQPGTAVIAYHGIPDVADEEWDSLPG
ncbi:ricin-type beta-trefoil lectin domain protein [Mycobacterium sp. pUA109]|uniref:ricin-type beta-trefoil lectin domain protein n=1 Tax=Mycobacterium sp. pUA109 TaxID=3238982 RepID=UPI00351B9851